MIKNYDHLTVIKFLISLLNNNFHRHFNNELCPCWTLEQMALECKLSIMPQFFSSPFWITAMIWERDPSCWSALMLQCWGSVCWGMHSVQVPQCAAAVELQVSSGWQSPRQEAMNCCPLHNKGTTKGPMASQVRDTQRCSRSWEAQTFTYLDCKGIKPQGFLCSVSSSEAPVRAVTQLMHHFKDPDS